MKITKYKKNQRKAFFADKNGSISKRIEKLRVGRSITVEITESQRKMVLSAATLAGKRLTTRATRDGRGFTITRLMNQ